MSDNSESSLSRDTQDGSERSNPTSSNQVQSAVSSSDGDMKRAAAQRIERYYFQLKDGCGNVLCDNPNCASSGKVGTLSNNDAAVKALQLFSTNAKMCDPSTAKTCSDRGANVSQNQRLLQGTETKIQPGIVPRLDTDVDMNPLSVAAPSDNKGSVLSKVLQSKFQSKAPEKICGLTEEHLKSVIKTCKSTGQYGILRILLRTVFSNDIVLKNSFLKVPDNDLKVSGSKKKCEPEKKNSEDDVCAGSEQQPVTKEQLRSAGSDLDKDIDCQEMSTDNNDINMDESGQLEPAAQSTKPLEKVPLVVKLPQLDIESVRRAYQALFEVSEGEFLSTLLDAMRQLLRDTLGIAATSFGRQFREDTALVNVFVILLENPHLPSTEFTEEVLGDLCRVLRQLGGAQQAAIVQHLAHKWTPTRLHRFLESLHQLITIRLLTTQFSDDFTINNEETITAATRVMKIVYFTAIVGGQLDQPLLKDVPHVKEVAPPPPSSSGPPGALSEHLASVSWKESSSKAPPWDPLATELGVHPLDSRIPSIPFEDFYDDFLSDQLEMERDYIYYKTVDENEDQFSFLRYPFILTPATKVFALNLDNRMRMYNERNMTALQTYLEGTPANPYLSLHIRRDHIIDDALVGLELVALENPGDLKKQLVVEFEGEQGIDEGGVSKEFFQLIIEQLFNLDYGMFCLNSETKTFLFNPTSFESDAQFTLVGLVLGLAIYNNVILDLQFPPVVYKKLCGKPGTFHDLKDWNPTLYKSLLDLLAYEGDDMEEVFMQTFRVGYQDIFGTSLYQDLKPDGDNMFVSQRNKNEFVSLYANFLLNTNVSCQFSAFKRGFCMVTDDSPIQQLFRPHELEMIVCGSQHYDFSELRKSTIYDGGFSANSPVVRWFWELVDELGSEEKKQLLQFTTGSARVPVGGLARLKFIIARHGPDTDRLPTAHTCFNVLLLPDYKSKEKLNERLLKAIKYAQGFGML